MVSLPSTILGKKYSRMQDCIWQEYDWQNRVGLTAHNSLIWIWAPSIKNGNLLIIQKSNCRTWISYLNWGILKNKKNKKSAKKKLSIFLIQITVLNSKL